MKSKEPEGWKTQHCGSVFKEPLMKTNEPEIWKIKHCGLVS